MRCDEPLSKRVVVAEQQLPPRPALLDAAAVLRPQLGPLLVAAVV